MNNAGIQRAEKLAQKEYTAIEYRSRLVRMQNMDLICHCSAEIDMGTLLYFSVNDLYMGKGNYVILLFSEISEISESQKDGRDVFSRMFTYAVIEEIAKEVFTGHYSFFSSELDGRLVLILSFPFGLLPDPSIVDYLGDNCVEISRRCRDRYDMNVVTYISEPIENIHYISSIYTKLLETATLHRYIHRQFDVPTFRVAMPMPEKWEGRREPAEEDAKQVIRAIFNGEDYHAEADRALDLMAHDDSASGIDNLKRVFGDYFELICIYAARMGIKLKTDDLRAEQFRILFDSVRWEQPVQWLHNFLDILHENYSESQQKAARRQYDDALAYIDSSLSDPALTIDSCAAAVGCSISALSKLFRRQLNTSVAKYIRDRRLDTALALLKEGRSVGDTCQACGFGSTETFHRAFKARFGITPGALRGSRTQEEAGKE